MSSKSAPPGNPGGAYLLQREHSGAEGAGTRVHDCRRDATRPRSSGPQRLLRLDDIRPHFGNTVLHVSETARLLERAVTQPFQLRDVSPRHHELTRLRITCRHLLVPVKTGMIAKPGRSRLHEGTFGQARRSRYTPRGHCGGGILLRCFCTLFSVPFQ